MAADRANGAVRSMELYLRSTELLELCTGNCWTYIATISVAAGVVAPHRCCNGGSVVGDTTLGADSCRKRLCTKSTVRYVYEWP
jgi:hypothetical protein